MDNPVKSPEETLRRKRQIYFVKTVFGKLCELEPDDEPNEASPWAGQIMQHITALQEKYGSKVVCDCRLYHLAAGSTHDSDVDPSIPPPSIFDFEGQDSILAFMNSLGDEKLPAETMEILRQVCRIDPSPKKDHNE